jgi:copper chaperone NosL
MRATSRMPRSARATLLVAVVLLGGLFVTPLWSVRLVAPQYPEGIGMLIRLNNVVGMKEHDLRNINSLNHYIGMKPIEPDAIPELQYMPWIAAGLIAAGILVAAAGRRRLLVTWTAVFALLGAAGIYDFWRWSYDYGHNLDVENAIIVVPGMTYQPPLLGTKQLLNFTATSLPAAGGLLAGVSFALALGAIALSYRRVRAGAAALTLVAAACASNPSIAFGQAQCEECRMLVSDRRFGALVETDHGRKLTFDSIDCLRTFMARTGSPTAHETWVVDASVPGTLVALESATVVESDSTLRPPMGNAVSYGAGHAR